MLPVSCRKCRSLVTGVTTRLNKIMTLLLQCRFILVTAYSTKYCKPILSLQFNLNQNVSVDKNKQTWTQLGIDNRAMEKFQHTLSTHKIIYLARN